MPKNQGLYVYLTTKTKKKSCPFLTFTHRFENLRKGPPFVIKHRIFLGFLFDIKRTNFL